MALQNMILYARIVRWLKVIETSIKLVALALAGCLAVIVWNICIAHRGYDVVPVLLTVMWVLAACLSVLTLFELTLIGPARSAVLRRRRRSHCCLSCNYRLDGAMVNREGALICPECGWRDNDKVRLYFSWTPEI